MSSPSTTTKQTNNAMSPPPATSISGLGGNVSAYGIQTLPRQGMMTESVRLATGNIMRSISIASAKSVGQSFQFELSYRVQDDLSGPVGLAV